MFVVVVENWTQQTVYKQWGLRSPSSEAWKSKIKAETSESGAASEEWLLRYQETTHVLEHVLRIVSVPE